MAQQGYGAMGLYVARANSSKMRQEWLFVIVVIFTVLVCVRV